MGRLNEVAIEVEDVEIKRESEKSFLVTSNNNVTNWIPKSQIDNLDAVLDAWRMGGGELEVSGTIVPIPYMTIPGWLARKVGFM